ncbi:hypothetical protein [Streptomyces sp. AC627_RSS907]|uniref:hypothetical protein n=1 Tax=Streptomyces sp. AC627_RSS907 TaxID=2823684 RepID=UPI001C25629B|nr:hypothetical protein [Streptomyces sp. AC627_RSS907]
MDLTTVLMLSVGVTGVVATMASRGRWEAPLGLVAATMILTFPVTYILLEWLADGAERWLTMTFQVGTSLLVSVLASPLYRRWWQGGATADAAH